MSWRVGVQLSPTMQSKPATGPLEASWDYLSSRSRVNKVLPPLLLLLNHTCIPLELRFCFHQHPRFSKSDFEGALLLYVLQLPLYHLNIPSSHRRDYHYSTTLATTTTVVREYFWPREWWTRNGGLLNPRDQPCEQPRDQQVACAQR